MELRKPAGHLPIANRHAAWNSPHQRFCLQEDLGTPENRVALISLLNAILELGRYNLRESELRSASLLDCWLYWLLHAHEYEPAALLELLPRLAIRQATETLARIAQISEDKAMYDAREKAIRDRKWELNGAFREGQREGEIRGKIEGKIETIQTLQGILRVPVSEEQELRTLTLEQLQALTSSLQEKLRNRTLSV